MIISAVLLTFSANPRLKNPFKIEENILVKVTSEAEGMQRILKCLVNLGVNVFLPPPGGAEQINRVVF